MDEIARAEIKRGDPMLGEPITLVELTSYRGRIWRVWLDHDGQPLIKHMGWGHKPSVDLSSGQSDQG